MTANKPPAGTRMVLDQVALLNAAADANFRLQVFLAGPYIESTGKKPGRSGKRKAERLRYVLYHRLSEAGSIVMMGEYEALIDAAKPRLGSRNNAAIAEIDYVKNYSNAVVIILSSPGSFAELGSFCTSETICKKMLIIINKTYEEDGKNYLNTGPLVVARNNGSKVVYVDYDDHDACLAYVDELINDQRGRLAERAILS